MGSFFLRRKGAACFFVLGRSRVAGGRFLAQALGIEGRAPTRSQADGTLAQLVQQGEFFENAAAGEFPTKGAFAGKNLVKIESHLGVGKKLADKLLPCPGQLVPGEDGLE